MSVPQQPYTPASIPEAQVPGFDPLAVPEAPPMPEEYDQDDRAIPEIDWHQAQIRHDADIAGPEYIFRQEKTEFMPLRNLHCIRAEAKHGKTWVCKLLLAAAITGGYIGLDCLKSHPKVAFFDTEQDDSDSIGISKAVNYIAHRPNKDQRDDFVTVNIMEYDIPEMWGIIRNYIRTERPTFVVIDGIADLMDDPNDLKESKDIIKRLRKYAKRYNCCIFTVIHVNPETVKERGHIGTECQRKCCDMLQVKKVEVGGEGTGNFRYDVTMPRTRHKPIKGFSFDIDDHGIPQPVVFNPENPTPDGQPPIDIPSLLFGLLSKGGVKKTRLLESMAEAIGKSASSADRLLTKYLELGTCHKDRDTGLIVWGPDEEQEMDMPDLNEHPDAPF